MSDDKHALERTLELLVYAPVGAGLFLRDVAPSYLATFVARGRAEIERRQGDVGRRATTARSLGQVALAFGVPMLRRRFEGYVSEAQRRAQAVLARAPAAGVAPVPPSAPPDAHRGAGRRDGLAPTAARVAATTAARPKTGAVAPGAAPTAAPWHAVGSGQVDDTPARDELPIPGYDALSASQVVERLAGLGPEELDAVAAYEARHRQRRTILGKIEQLVG
jgi:hypothetical protein